MYDFTSIHRNDRSADSLGFSFGMFVNNYGGIPANCTQFISGGFSFRKTNSCSIHLSASKLLHRTHFKLSPALEPSLPSSLCLCRPVLSLLSGAGGEQLVSGTSQEDEAAEKSQEMCPVIGLLSSFYIFFSFSFISGYIEFKIILIIKRIRPLMAWQKDQSCCWSISFFKYYLRKFLLKFEIEWKKVKK